MSEEETKHENGNKSTSTKSSKPPHLDLHHQDGLFSNTFQAKSCFSVHPEWLSEDGTYPGPVPLSRPPWPWEQPRYRVNLQTPITYKSPAECAGQEAEGSREVAWRPAVSPAEPETQDNVLDQAKFRNYIFTHPSPHEAPVLHHGQDICVPRS